MKRIITLLSISLILLSFSACTSDEPYVPDCHTEEETITEPEANYYIKYLAQGNRNAGWIKSITVNTESGEKTITKQMSSWNETYGPVPKGFFSSTDVDISFFAVSRNFNTGLKSFGDRTISFVP